MTLQITSESAINHILRHRPARIQSLTLFGKSNPRISELEALAKQNRIACHREAKAGTDPVSATLHPFEYSDWKEFRDRMKEKTHCVVLALDHLQDPQNFGALCRTAEALGVEGIILPKDRSVAVSAGVYHASVGAVDTIPIVLVTNLNESLRQLKEAGLWILGSALGEGSRPIDETPDFEKKVLVMGSELEGMSEHTKKLCDWLIEIPLRGKVQSLNVSAAGAILLHKLI
jgi:23S rRNA (guanosine2251-2'-O)-methyltransferase